MSQFLILFIFNFSPTEKPKNMNDIYKSTYEEIMKNEDQFLHILFAKLIFLGPPERGKTLTRLRLVNKMKNMTLNPEFKNHRSTQMAETGSYLITDLLQSAAVLSEKGWKPIEGESDEVNLLYQLFLKLKESMPETELSICQKLIFKIKQMFAGIWKTTEDTSESNLILNRILHLYDKSSADGKWEEIASKLDDLCLLYMKDTGGQPELMDMLPALIMGPAIYLLFCKYGDDLKKPYGILFREADNCIKPDEIPMSSFTVEQNLKASLSAIFSMPSTSTPQNSQWDDGVKNTPKSVAYIIGTHRDVVKPDGMIAFEEKMQSVITNTVFFNKELVRFVSTDGFESKNPEDDLPKGMKRLIYPINNKSGTTKEIEGLQKFIHKALDRFPRQKIPARWLPFSLYLRFTKEKCVKLSTCYKVGDSLNMSEIDTRTALWFFHHFAGIILYFHDEALSNDENFVVTDTQLVFNIISDLILETGGMKLRQNAGKTLRSVGQISFADITKVSGDVFLPKQIESLLRHIHVIAPLDKPLIEEKFPTEDPHQLYFMPCALSSLSKAELNKKIQLEKTEGASVYNVKFWFIAEFVPIGLFASMIAKLVGLGKVRVYSQLTYCAVIDFKL